MIVSSELEDMWKEVVQAYLEQFWQLCGDSELNVWNPQCLTQNFNAVPSGYKSVCFYSLSRDLYNSYVLLNAKMASNVLLLMHCT